MSSTLIKEIDAIQTDMVCMEGMLEALAKGAYNGTRVEYIGNSLEILRDYLGQRSERLDLATAPLRVMHMEADEGKDFSDKWERFAADDSNMGRQSMEVVEAYAVMDAYLEKAGCGKKELRLAVREIGDASRKQGFIEGYKAAAGICAENGGVE